MSNKAEMPINSGLFIMVTAILCVLFIGNYNALADIGSFVIFFLHTDIYRAIYSKKKMAR